MHLDLTRTKNMQGLDPSSCVNMTFAKYAQVIETPCKVLGKNFNPGIRTQAKMKLYLAKMKLYLAKMKLYLFAYKILQLLLQ